MAIEKVIDVKVVETGFDLLNKDLAATATAIKNVDKEAENLNKDLGKTEFKTFKQQLREANQELKIMSERFGETSAEAVKAAKNVARINDEMEFQRDLVKSYNPDEKFRSLTQTAGIATLALGGLKDGFTALGVESETLDKIIGTAQAILGVTSTISGLSDAYGVLTASQKAKSAANLVEAGTAEVAAVAETEAAAATWSWNAALLANPIGLVVAAVVAATAAIYAYVKITSDAVSEEEKLKFASMELEQAINNQAKAFDNNNKFLSKSNDHKINLLRASGASEKQIYAETKALGEQELQLAKNYRAEALLLEQRAYEANRDNPTEFNAKTLANAKDNITKAEKAVSDAYDNLINLQNEHEVALVQQQTEARKKAEEKRKEKQKKELEDQKKHNQDLLTEATKHQNDLLKLGENPLNKPVTAESLKEQSKALAEQTAKNAQDQRDQNNQIKQNELEDLEYWNKQAETAIAKSADDKIKRKKVENEALNNLGTSAIAAAKDLFGKSKGVQKGIIATEGAIALGKVAVNTIEQVSEDNVASPLTFGLPWSAIHIATGALGAASIVANTNKQLQAVGGGSVSASPNNLTQPSDGGRATAPQFNLSQGTTQGALALANQNKQEPIKAFVVGQDISNQQQLDLRIQQTASFG